MLIGHEAIEYAERHGLTLNKYADPTEGAREGLTVEEARDVAAEDPSLIHLAPVSATTTQPQVLEPRQSEMASYLDVIETGAPVVLIMRRWDLERAAYVGMRWAGPMDAVAAYVGGERIWENYSGEMRWSEATIAAQVEYARRRLAAAAPELAR